VTMIYLAGPIAAEPDGGAAWREQLIADYPGVEWLNPLDRFNAPLEELVIVDAPTEDDGAVSVRELVEHDKRLLQRADGILAGYADVQQIGTPMEVIAGWRDDIPVSMWTRDDTPLTDISPWYRYHCGQITNDRGLAVSYLQRRCAE